MTDLSDGPPEVYDRTAIKLHWATAMLVVIEFLIGRTTNLLPRGPLRVDIWSVHVILGFALASVVVSGMLWRVTRGRRLPPPDRGVLHLAALATHRLLDVLLLIMVALGITNVFAHGFPLFNLWHFPKLGSGEFMHGVNAWHGSIANVVIVVALFHSAAALFHHHVIKDGVLRRMWPSLTER
ncbi:cytochrome b [Bradyrhizobium septentrionale]|uniref:Cytochrome b/b6 domain-containing protein n=2 Tax=Bradyrhizobium septentrionale TaxID=1404411 RepID=A0A973W9J7_9BRAD|nr:cytochrome b/b6 domain-containing protein [Bradyrhizobium septentrionale]UGY27062.1 cytochrome b/b6 domain-containing protein [Bradyrhizobium septentrionale]